MLLTHSNLVSENPMSTDLLKIYNVTDNKYIGVHLTSTDRVAKIRLMDDSIGGDCLVAEYCCNRILYYQDITLEGWLDLDAISYYDDYFTEVC